MGLPMGRVAIFVAIGRSELIRDGDRTPGGLLRGLDCSGVRELLHIYCIYIIIYYPLVI